METAEIKNERFKRLAGARVNKVLTGYRLLSNLAGANYKSTIEQRQEILSALRKGLEEIEYVWANEKPKKENFQFKSEIE